MSERASADNGKERGVGVSRAGRAAVDLPIGRPGFRETELPETAGPHLPAARESRLTRVSRDDKSSRNVVSRFLRTSPHAGVDKNRGRVVPSAWCFTRSVHRFMLTENLGTTQETKYVFPLPATQWLQDWLDVHCLHDVKYAGGRVYSLYYDTPTLALYREKENSDYIKTKIRLRWYAPAEGQGDTADDTTVPCFLELKRKVGVTREKRRLRVDVSAVSLFGQPFLDPFLRDLPFEAYGLGELSPAEFVPAAVVQYQRRRYVDPLSGARLSLDSEICCRQANDELFPAPVSVSLAWGVFEVKGSDGSIPLALEPVASLLSKEAFSKYGAVVAALRDPVGAGI